MAVDVGEKAPDFRLYTHEREPFRLQDFEGKKNVLLLFFPAAFSSVCTRELTEANRGFPDFQSSDTLVVGISTDAPGVLRKFREEQGFRFPLLSDHEAEVSEHYGARYSREESNIDSSRIAKRAAFVIDKEGVVRYAEVLDNAGELPDFDAIRNVLQELD